MTPERGAVLPHDGEDGGRPVGERDQASPSAVPARTAVEDVHVPAGREARDSEGDGDGVRVAHVQSGDAVVAASVRRPETRCGANGALAVAKMAGVRLGCQLCGNEIQR